MKKNRIVSLLALASMMISSAVFPVQADTIQGYENIALPEETIHAEISNEQAHTGLTSLKVFQDQKPTQPDTARFLEMATPALTDNSVTGEMVAEGWFYDANGDSRDRDTLCASMPLIYFESADGQTKISVGAYRQTLNWGGGYDYTYYGYSLEDPSVVPENIGENSGFNSYSGSNGWSLVTNAGNWVSRTKGWHHVRIEVSPEDKNNGTNIIFDGKWVAWLNGKTSPIVKVQGIAHPWSDVYNRTKADWMKDYIAFYDDFSIYSKAERTVTVNTEGSGTVYDGETPVGNGAGLSVVGGATKTLTLAPAEGSYVDQVTVNGTPYFVQNNSITIPSIIENKTVRVVFSSEHKHAVSVEATEGGAVLEQSGSEGTDVRNTVSFLPHGTQKSYLVRSDSGNQYDIVRITVNGEEISLTSTQDKEEKEITVPVDQDCQIRVWFQKNKQPVVSSASIQCNSIPVAGDTLEIAAEIIDPDGDELAAPLYQWQRLTENEYVDIEGAVNESYLLTEVDVGAKIRVKITPRSTRGTVIGEPFVTEPTETVTAGLRKAANYYVSAQTGSDLNSGSEQYPFQTIEKARDTVASVIGDEDLEEGTITIYIRGGDYYVSQSLLFDAQHSGTKKNPIVYQAYGNEKVRLIGGEHLENSRIHPVEDKSILNRIQDSTARELLCYIDLDGIEIPEEMDLAHQYNWDSIRHRFEIFINGSGLDRARWPNKTDVSGGWLQMDKPTQNTQANDGSCFATFARYQDSSSEAEQALRERVASWPEDSRSGLRMAGYIPYTWSYMEQDVLDLDPETLTLKTLGNRPSYGLWWNAGGGRFYFYNILEELDQPGESYLDREHQRIYFYPAQQDLTDAEIFVPALEQPILQLNGASHITFKNLSLLYSREKAVQAENVDDVWIDGCEIAHTCDLGGSMSGQNSGVKNTHIYDTAKGGLKIFGGDRKTLTPGNMLVENCRIHSVDRVFKAWANLVVLSGVGNTLRGCDLYDADHQLVGLGGNDHVLEYNKFYHAALETGDVGAIYYGDDQSCLGFEIRNNFFADIGNNYTGHGEQAIFWDDASIGPHISGNIFYRATRTQDQGATAEGRYAAMKSFWGHFGLAENNLFIDVPVIGRFESRRDGGQTYQQAADSATYWWKALMNSNVLSKQPSWSKIQNSDFDFMAWKEHYQGTQWQQLYDLASNEIKAAYDEADDAGKQKMAEQYAPGRSNVVHNNVGIGLLTDELRGYSGNSDANGTIEEIYSMSMSEGKSLFVDYGTNFTLTKEGMAKINRVLPNFKEIQYAEMGCKGIGSNPSVTDVTVEGARVNNLACVNYTFSDADQDKEGKSTFQWYLADSENGEYQKIAGAVGYKLMILPEYLGKYLKCSVIPQDSTFCYPQEAVTSAPVLVGDDLSLEEAIRKAQQLYDQTQAGEKLGNSTPQAMEALLEQINQAKALEQPDKAAAEQAIQGLVSAMDEVAKSMVTEATLKDGESAQIPLTSKPVTITLEGKSAITLPAGKELPQMEISGLVTIGGTAWPVSLTIPKGTVAKEGGVLTLFESDANPSASVSGTNVTAVHFAGQEVAFSQPVRIALQGTGGKAVQMLIQDKFSSSSVISQDSFEAAESKLAGKAGWCRVKNSDPLVGYTNSLQELAVFTMSSPSPSPEVSPTPVIGGGGGTVSKPAVGPVNPPSPSPSPECEFTDIDGHWAKADIEALYQKGIVTGVTQTIFEPDRNITRAEFATLMTKALQITGGSGSDFSDVSEEDWFCPYVAAAARAGFISGYQGEFRPNDWITREEMAVILARAYQFLGYQEKTGAILQFEDAEEIADWAYSYVDQMTSAGLISGMAGSLFAGKEATTRAQAVSVIARLLALSKS